MADISATHADYREHSIERRSAIDRPADSQTLKSHAKFEHTTTTAEDYQPTIGDRYEARSRPRDSGALRVSVYTQAESVKRRTIFAVRGRNRRSIGNKSRISPARDRSASRAASTRRLADAQIKCGTRHQNNRRRGVSPSARRSDRPIRDAAAAAIIGNLEGKFVGGKTNEMLVL